MIKRMLIIFIFAMLSLIAPQWHGTPLYRKYIFIGYVKNEVPSAFTRPYFELNCQRHVNALANLLIHVMI